MTKNDHRPVGATIELVALCSPQIFPHSGEAGATGQTPTRLVVLLSRGPCGGQGPARTWPLVMTSVPLRIRILFTHTPLNGCQRWAGTRSVLGAAAGRPRSCPPAPLQQLPPALLSPAPASSPSCFVPAACCSGGSLAQHKLSFSFLLKNTQGFPGVD